MATPPPPQRAYRAACPNCGAPVEFRSAAAPFAVCSFCRSTVVRAGDQLRKIGESAEVFDDHTPLQLGAAGTLPGRDLHASSAGSSTATPTAPGTSGTPCSRAARSCRSRAGCPTTTAATSSPSTRRCRRAVPPPENLRPGAPLTVNGESWSVASVVAAKLIAAQGELPRRPNLEQGLRRRRPAQRARRGRHARLHRAGAADAGRSGRSVSLSDLAMTGLREAGEKTLSGRTLNCPNCGAALEVKLETTQSIVCHQCKAVVDVSQGIGGDLAHYAQDNGTRAADPARHASAPSPSAARRRCRGRWSATSSAARSRRATRTSRPSGASTCSTTGPRASPSSSTPRTAGAGRSRSPARRRSRATPPGTRA